MILKKYENFVNENIFTNILSRVINFFKSKFGKDSFAYLALFLSKKNKIPKDENGQPKVIIRVPDSWYNNKEINDAEKEFSSIKTESQIYIENEEKLNESLKNARFNIMRITRDHFQINEGTKYRRPDYDPKDYINLDHDEIDNYDVEELRKEIIKYYKMSMSGDRSSLFIWGAPGVGKTSVTKQIANELNVMIEVWTLATLEATDLKGVPAMRKFKPDPNMPEELRKAMEKDIEKGNLDYTETINALPLVLPTSNWNSKNHNGGILFFDELNRAIPSVLDASLSLTLNGKMDEYELPDKWFIIAAGNRVSDIQGGNITALEPAILNRFDHINFAPNFRDWVNYVSKKPYMNPDIIEFLESDKENIDKGNRPEYYYKLMSNFYKVNENPAAPTPRAWEAASKTHFSWEGVDGNWNNKLPYDEILTIYKPAVGHEAANEFVDFLKKKEIEERKKEEEKRKKEFEEKRKNKK